jgi:hypothetical protein
VESILSKPYLRAELLQALVGRAARGSLILLISSSGIHCMHSGDEGLRAADGPTTRNEHGHQPYARSRSPAVSGSRGLCHVDFAR